MGRERGREREGIQSVGERGVDVGEREKEGGGNGK
jgi:hypothetical protein